MTAGREGSLDLWGDRPPPRPDAPERVNVGPLTLWLRSEHNEIWVAHHHQSEKGGPPDEQPDDAEWSRWALVNRPHRLRLRPVFPDRPLVVKPEHPFTLLRRAEARLYVRIPVWVCLEVVEEGRRKTTVLTEIPTEPLSDTWWGDFLDGELAYWLSTKGRRAVTPDLFHPHLVMATLQLSNLSEDDLAVEKLALRVEHLSIYLKDDQLWAEEVRVHYHGEEEGSEIHMDDEPPVEAEGAVELSAARAQARSLRARTFARLRAWSGWSA
jgi:hypothetical protein